MVGWLGLDSCGPRTHSQKHRNMAMLVRQKSFRLASSMSSLEKLPSKLILVAEVENVSSLTPLKGLLLDQHGSRRWSARHTLSQL